MPPLTSATSSPNGQKSPENREKRSNVRRTFLEMSQDGNVSALKKFVEEHNLSRDDICRAKDSYGRTALMLACMANHIDCAGYLVSLGAKINVSDNTGWTALAWAARDGNLPVVEFLCQHGAHMDQQDLFGHTAVMYAVHYEKLDVIEYLCGRGASVPQDLVNVQPDHIVDAVKRGQRTLHYESPEEKKAVNILSVSKAVMRKGENEEEVPKEDIMDSELRFLVQGQHCSCPMMHSKKCYFFTASS